MGSSTSELLAPTVPTTVTAAAMWILTRHGMADTSFPQPAGRLYLLWGAALP